MSEIVGLWSPTRKRCPANRITSSQHTGSYTQMDVHDSNFYQSEKQRREERFGKFLRLDVALQGSWSLPRPLGVTEINNGQCGHHFK